MNWWARIAWPGPLGLVEILVLSALFYLAIRFFRGTPGAHVLFGLAGLVTALLALTWVAHLETLNWVLRQLSLYVAVGLLILFQPELRRALAELGRRHLVWQAASSSRALDEVVRAAEGLAGRRVGALIAIERNIGTRAVQETGVCLDAQVSAELLETIFQPRSPLHDGGVVIVGSRLSAASCTFPLTQRLDVSRAFGTRHRAALGLTEETDAVCVVVSEETGAISACIRGRMTRNLDGPRLRKFLLGFLMKRPRAGRMWFRSSAAEPAAGAGEGAR